MTVFNFGFEVNAAGWTQAKITDSNGDIFTEFHKQI